MVLMEGHGEIVYSSSSSTSSSDESDDEIQSNPEEVPTRSLIPTPAPAPTTSTAVVGSHVVEIPHMNNAPVLGTPLVGGSTPVLGYPFTQIQQTRPIMLEIPNPNAALVPAVNQTQQTIHRVENLGNCCPHGPDPRSNVLPPRLAAARHQLAEAAREIALTRRAMYPPIHPMTTENNSNGAPMAWPSWNNSNQNFHCHQTSSHPQVGLNEQCCAAFSFAQTTVPTTNHHATAYLPTMVPYQIEQPMPQPPMMEQNIVNPTRFRAEASASGPTRRMRSLVYDPAYERMGLPVDPHLRAFLASTFNNNK